MTHFAIARTPYGNFAVCAASSDDSPHTIESFMFEPIGQLDEIPIRQAVGVGEVLDLEALRVEAHRQLAARGTASPKFLHPSPEFTINRVHYSHYFTLVTRKTWNSDAPHTYLDAYTTMTDSAQAKLVTWWAEHRDEIVTPEFLALSELARARSAQSWAGRQHADASKALVEAEDKLTAAGDRVLAALAAVNAARNAERANASR